LQTVERNDFTFIATDDEGNYCQSIAKDKPIDLVEANDLAVCKDFFANPMLCPKLAEIRHVDFTQPADVLSHSTILLYEELLLAASGHLQKT
jgi:hypothetical protein